MFELGPIIIYTKLFIKDFLILFFWYSSKNIISDLSFFFTYDVLMNIKTRLYVINNQIYEEAKSGSYAGWPIIAITTSFK